MEFTAEQIRTAKKAKTAEELMEFAKENGMKLTEDEARSFISRWHRTGALSDEELNNVSGGCGGSSTPDPRYKIGQHLWLGYPSSRTYVEVVIETFEFYTEGEGWRYLVTVPKYGIDRNEYLETRKYVFTTDPGPKWVDV